MSGAVHPADDGSLAQFPIGTSHELTLPRPSAPTGSLPDILTHFHRWITGPRCSIPRLTAALPRVRHAPVIRHPPTVGTCSRYKCTVALKSCQVTSAPLLVCVVQDAAFHNFGNHR